MSYYSDEDFEHLAKILREALGLDNEIKLDAIEFLRRMKREGYIADYVRVPDTKLPDAEAIFKPDERKIYIRESVYAAAEKWSDHARFTVFHECAHAALEHQFERKRSLATAAAAEKRVASIRRDEVQANKLAAAIIAPFHRSDFTLSTTIQELMARFGLSLTAATKRLEEMAGIFRRQHNIPRPLPPGVYDFLAARRREGHTVTSLPATDSVAMRIRTPTYTGEACPVCGEFKMIRIATHMKCDSGSCGATTGDD